MRKNLIMSVLGLSVLLTGVSCKKKKEEEINLPPMVTVDAQFLTTLTRTTAPANYAIKITASATDPDGTISKVVFFLNDTNVSEDTEAPFEVTTSTFQGENDIYAVAYDSKGASTKSAVIERNVIF